jgi:hypothetical protein
LSRDARNLPLTGKPCRKAGGRETLRVASALVGKQRLITPIPYLLDSITIKNDVVTIDAMGYRTNYQDIREYVEYLDDSSYSRTVGTPLC